MVEVEADEATARELARGARRPRPRGEPADGALARPAARPHAAPGGEGGGDRAEPRSHRRAAGVGSGLHRPGDRRRDRGHRRRVVPSRADRPLPRLGRRRRVPRLQLARRHPRDAALQRLRRRLSRAVRRRRARHGGRGPRGGRRRRCEPHRRRARRPLDRVPQHGPRRRHPRAVRRVLRILPRADRRERREPPAGARCRRRQQLVDLPGRGRLCGPRDPPGRGRGPARRGCRRGLRRGQLGTELRVAVGRAGDLRRGIHCGRHVPDRRDRELQRARAGDARFLAPCEARHLRAGRERADELRPEPERALRDLRRDLGGFAARRGRHRAPLVRGPVARGRRGRHRGSSRSDGGAAAVRDRLRRASRYRRSQPGLRLGDGSTSRRRSRPCRRAACPRRPRDRAPKPASCPLVPEAARNPDSWPAPQGSAVRR